MNGHGTVLNYNRLYKVLSRKITFTPSDDVMQKILVLALLAGVSDGRIVREELDVIRSNIVQRFNKTEADFIKLLAGADKFLDTCDSKLLFRLVCDELKTKLSQSQLLEIYDFLADVVLADNKLSNEEGVFFDNLVSSFNLSHLLSSKRPDPLSRRAYWRE